MIDNIKKRAGDYLDRRKNGNPLYNIYFEPIIHNEIKRLGLEDLTNSLGDLETFILTTKGYLFRGFNPDLEFKSARIDLESSKYNDVYCDVGEERAMVFRYRNDIIFCYITREAENRIRELTKEFRCSLQKEALKIAQKREKNK